MGFFGRLTARGWMVPRGAKLRLDRETHAWGISLAVHACIIMLLMILTLPLPVEDAVVLLSSADRWGQEPAFDRVHYADETEDEIGASRAAEPETALETDTSPATEPLAVVDLGQIEVAPRMGQPPSATLNIRLGVAGAAGVGVTGALGAVDRITHEILLSLEQRKTLVVWIFDQSGSLQRQREKILARFERVYEELGVLRARGNDAFVRHQDQPLLTAVMAFGQDCSHRTRKPTDDLDEIRQAVAGIEIDPSGKEFVFSAVYEAAREFRRLRLGTSRRNVMIVVVTDEAGDDMEGLDQTVDICRRQAMPVYVVGVPAPFGRHTALIQYVDPDPNFDQSPQWVPVVQGPESFMPERIRLHLDGRRDTIWPWGGHWR